MIDKVTKLISSTRDKRIVMLRNKEVIQWLVDDLSFLPSIEKTKNKSKDELRYKNLEDEWGRQVLKSRRPDLKLDKQWTNKFGEYIAEELYILNKTSVLKPVKKNNYQPDLETDSAIIEVKTGTYFTSGTAGEKILGCPFKYCEIPDIYSKPLIILCIGGAEKMCREQYGNLAGEKCSKQKKKFLSFFKRNRIEYKGATELLQSIIN